MINEPQETEPESGGRRNYVGWIVLALMFGYMALGSFVSTFNRKPEETSKYTANEMQLRLLSSQLQAMRDFVPANDREQVEKQIQESLTTSVAELVDAADKSPEAARLYAVMRTEQGRSIRPSALETLRKSKAKGDAALAKIYGAKKLTLPEAKALSAQLPSEPFSYVLARAQAFEKAGDKGERGRIVSSTMFFKTALATMLGMGLLLGSAVVWFVYLSGKKGGKFAPQGHPVGEISLVDADRLAIRAAQILGSYFVLSLLVGRFVGGKAGNLAVGLGILAMLVILAKVPVDGRLISLQSLGLSSRRLGKNIVWGIAGFLGELPITGMLGILGVVLFSGLGAPSHPATEALRQTKDLGTVFTILFLGSILAPIWEEIMFRGLLFPALGRVSGRMVLGAVWSSLLFGLIHPQGPSLVLALAGVGGMSCALIYQTRSIVPSMVMHFLHNTTIFALLLLIT